MTTGEALITKKVIAYSFKHLMKTKDFNKISITEIMMQAELRRQTFYDHFTDKYDLLAWLYHQEFTENVEHYIDYEPWPEILKRVLSYFEKNKLFYQKALAVTEQNSFDQFLTEHTHQFFITILEKQEQPDLDLTSKTSSTAYSISEYSYFYAVGFTGIVKSWLLNNCREPIDDITDYLTVIIQHSIIQLLKNKETL